jgi:hypothetical protein
MHQEVSADRGTLEGIETMNKMRKAQVKGLNGNDMQGQAKFIACGCFRMLPNEIQLKNIRASN